jgi:hypothetical protein
MTAVKGTATLFCVEEVMLVSWQVNTHSVLYQLCFYLFALLHLFVFLHFILLVYFFITSIFLLFVSICFLNFLVSFCVLLLYPSFHSSKLSAHFNSSLSTHYVYIMCP